MQDDKRGVAQRIRETATQDRRAVTLELARQQPDEVLPELIRMTERGRRSLLRWYSRDDQVTGIRALGETGREAALDYLESVVKGHEVNLKPLDMKMHTEIRESIARLRVATAGRPRVEDVVWDHVGWE